MEQDNILLNANLQTTICPESLNVIDDPLMVPFRKERILDLFHASNDHKFVFTSSGAESICQILFSVFLEVSRKTGKTHFITSCIEDRACLQMMKRLEELGAFVKIAPVKENGEIDVEALSQLISPRTALISISMAQGLTGVIQPVEEIQKIAHEKGILLHLDASQAAGKYHFSFEELSCDYLSFSGDLFHSKIATGGLIAKKQAPLIPYILGGSELRGGQLDSSLFLSLAAACSQAMHYLDSFSLEVARLKHYFEKKILEKIPNSEILFQNSLTLPNTTVIYFPLCHQEALHYLLQRKNVFSQLGGTHTQQLYSLLLASSIKKETSSCSLSFAINRYTTKEHLDSAIKAMIECVNYLQAMSPGYSLAAHTQTYPQDKPNKKIREKIQNPKFFGSFTPLQAQEKGMRLETAEENGLKLYFLVDESDGVIADAKYQVFGPSTLIAIAEAVCELSIRKNHIQASRISAELLDQQLRTEKEISAFSVQANALLNQAISVLETLCEKCSDIACQSSDFDTTPILWDFSENPNGIEGWDEFSREKKLFLIKEVIDKEIRPYVELDAGGVEVVDLDDFNNLTIAYSGSCTTCYSATGSTLTAIQQILRQKIHPKITVIPKL